MKKSFMSVTAMVVSISVVIMFLCSSAVQAQTGNKFAYDKKENVETVYTLDKSGKYLTPKLKYDYVKDANGNVLVKNASRWDAGKGEWSPYYQITFTGDDVNSIVEYALWNKETQSFSLNQQKAVYCKDQNDSTITYLAYQWDEATDGWKLMEQTLIENYLAIHIGK